MKCGACGLAKWLLPGTKFNATVCPRCDTVAQGNGMRVGPPNSPGTRDGWFNAPFGDLK